MQGSYDPVLVALSYGVAVIASYIALYFGTRLFVIEGRARKFWLAMGGLCLGSGIWSMHFVGMSAYTMPMDMEMSFDGGLTLLSWVPAVLASTLALYVITRPTVKVRSIVASSLIMGAGICAMHYGGMYAMQMQPQISYDPLLFWLSVVIAVGASGAAMVICRAVRLVPDNLVFVTKSGAALVMGAAICGMHYTGMAAAIYNPDSAIPGENLLRGDWMGIPMAVISAVFLLIALIVALQDFREIEREKQVREQRAAWVEKRAHNDQVTGLATRHHFDQALLKRLTESGESFSLVYMELQGYQPLFNQQGEVQANNLVRHAADAFAAAFSGDSLVARFSRHGFIAMIPPVTEDELKVVAEAIRPAIAHHDQAREFGAWTMGCSSFPRSASSTRMLVIRAREPRVAVRYDGALAELGGSLMAT